MKTCLNRTLKLTAALVAGTFLSVGTGHAMEAGATDSASGTETIKVGTELVMLIDSSGSIDDREYQLQRDGYVAAFRDPQVQRMIRLQDGVAVWAYDFSDLDEKALLGHHILRTAADCEAFANTLAAQPRRYSEGTCIAIPLMEAAEMLVSNHIESDRTVIDISGDGECEFNKKRRRSKDYRHRDDLPGSLQEVKKNLPEGIQVNAIAIGTPSKKGNKSLAKYYNQKLRHGPNSFSLYSNGFEAFADGIRYKIKREITIPLTPLFD